MSKLITDTQKMDAIKTLRELTVLFGEETGICDILEMDHDIAPEELFYYFRTWEKFSGDVNYPVPHYLFSPQKAYDTCILWGNKTRYGKDRIELCIHIANEFKKEINSAYGRS